MRSYQCLPKTLLCRSIHRPLGSVSVVQALPHREHRVLHAVGNVNQWFYLRSAIKYVQVSASGPVGAAPAPS